MLKKTPFHSRTEALMQANQWRRWAGHTVASSYEMTHDREYLAIRNACVLIDVSALCKYRIEGKDALPFLNRLVTRDVSKCAVGSMMYTPWCDSHGKLIDDGTIAHLDENVYRLTSAEPNFRWLEDNALGMDVKIEEVTDEVASLAVQGPRSRELLMSLTDAPLAELKYYNFLNTKIAGLPVTISRTGYTGDLGFELWMDATNAETVWDALAKNGTSFGLQAAGIWALDVARIEAGLVMCEIDYTPANKAMTDAQTSSALEMGFSWAISWKKGNFVGRKALKAEKQNGSTTLLVGLEIDHKEFERQHYELGLTVPYPFMAWRSMIPLFSTVDGTQVGYATSGVWSPTLKKYIALGHLKPKHAEPGNVVKIDLSVDRFRRQFDAKVTGLPFFAPARKKDTL